MSSIPNDDVENSQHASVSLQASADGAKIEVKGKGASKLADALADIISPFSQGLGLVGDHISYARRVAAIKAASRARERLKEEGISNGSIPPKILLPWLEGASLETENDESLTEMWAGLFVRAVKSSDAVNISYIETLKHLGKDEAQLLHFFATDTSPGFSLKYYDLSPFDNAFSSSNPLFQAALEKLDRIQSRDELWERIEGIFFQFMRQIMFFRVEGGVFEASTYFTEHEHVISNLERLGLVSIKKRQFPTSLHIYEFVWFELTKFGFDFFWACEGVKTGGLADLQRTNEQDGKT